MIKNIYKQLFKTKEVKSKKKKKNFEVKKHSSYQNKRRDRIQAR